MGRKPTGRPVGRPVGAIGTGKTDMARLARIHHNQVRLLDAQQRAIMERVRVAREADPAWVMPQDIREEINEITSYLARASNGMVQIYEAKERERASVSTDQLEAQFIAELRRSMRQFTREDWKVFDSIRAEVMKK